MAIRDVVDPAEQRAVFAETFKDAGTLDQRRRRAQDIGEAADRVKARREQDFENLQIQRPEVGRMVTGRMAEERQNRESIIKSNLAQDRFTWEQEKAQRLEGLNERKLKLQQVQEDRMLRKTERELKDAERIELDTDAFERGEEELRSSGFMPGSREYREGVLNLGARHPYVEPGFRRGVYEGAKIQMDADEIQAELADIQAKSPGAAVTIGPDGRPTIRASAKKPESDLKPDVRRLDKLTKERSEILQDKNPNQERLGYLNNEIAAIDKVRQAVAGNPPAEPAETAKAPDLTDPEQFKKAFQAAAPGTILTYGGRQWRKP